MIVEAFVAGRIGFGAMRGVAKETKSLEGELRCELTRDHAALDEDRQRCQSKADRSDARGRTRLRLVADEAVRGIGFVKVVLQRGQLKSAESRIGEKWFLRVRHRHVR